MKPSDTKYWNAVGQSYASAWTHSGRKYVSDQELQFLKDSLAKRVPKDKQKIFLTVAEFSKRNLQAIKDYKLEVSKGNTQNPNQ